MMNDLTFYSPALAEAPPRAPERTASLGTGSLVAIIGRIEEAIEAETTALRSDPKFDIRGSNDRKSRYLYEFNRAVKNIAARDLGETHRDAIARLRDKLRTNEAVIRAHLSAVSEVAGLIQSAIERAETDGTYSTSAFQRA